MNNYIIDDLMMESFVPTEVTQRVTQVDNKRLAILSFMGTNRLGFTKLYDLIKTHNVSEVTHLSMVHDLLLEYIDITSVDKKKYSITTTPISLAFDVLDKLPSSIWCNPESTFFDPSSGSGIFPLVIIHKLMDGLSRWETDPNKRYQHIVENMLYVSDVYAKLIFQLQCLIDPFEQYNLNVYCGSSVDNKCLSQIKNNWGIDEFTAIVGMPPYSHTYYIPFINKFANLTNYMAYIVPSKLTINDREITHLKNLKEAGLSHVTFIERGLYGNKISYMYFFVDRLSKAKLINVNDVAYIDKSEPLHNYKSKIEHSIIVKISNLWKVSLERGLNETIPYGVEIDNKNAKQSPTKEYSTKMLSRLGGGKRLEYHYIKKDRSEPGCKLVLPRASGNYYSITSHRKTERDFIYNTFVGNDIAVSRSIMYIRIKNREESERLSMYISRSLWIRYVFIKYNTFSELSKKIFSEFIPMIPLNVMMDDAAIFKFFKFSEGEIQHIKNVVYDL